MNATTSVLGLVFRRLAIFAVHPAVQLGVIAVTALAQSSVVMQQRQALPAPAAGQPTS